MYTSPEEQAVDIERVDIREKVSTQATSFESIEKKEKLQASLAAVGAFVCLCLLGAGIWFLVSDQVTKQTQAKEHLAALSAPLAQTPDSEKQFPAVTVLAKSAIVYDLKTGKVLYGKDEHSQRPLASVTKLMTALVATESLKASSTVLITNDALKAEGNSGLQAGEEWTLLDLLAFTMLSSSNDGARAIASAVGEVEDPQVSETEKRRIFFKKMNDKAAELGLSQTYYLNETGLDESLTTSGANGSAQDMAKLLVYMYEHAPEAFVGTVSLQNTFMSLSGTTYQGDNTNQYIGSIPGLIASKTGYTDLAGGNLAILFDAGLNRPVAIVVLGSTKEGRFQDVETLAKATLDYIAQ